mgnify:CR=1 FL=1
MKETYNLLLNKNVNKAVSLPNSTSSATYDKESKLKLIYKYIRKEGFQYGRLIERIISGLIAGIILFELFKWLGWK